MQELGFTATIAAPFLAAKEQVTRALAAEGFGVLTHIDVTATLQAKLGEKMEPYEILGGLQPSTGARGAFRPPQHRPATAVQRRTARSW